MVGRLMPVTAASLLAQASVASQRNQADSTSAAPFSRGISRFADHFCIVRQWPDKRKLFAMFVARLPF